MNEDDPSWILAGISEITFHSKERNSRYVRVPDRVFREEDILRLGHPVDWYYNTVSGILIITQERVLEEDEYNYTGRSTNFSEGDSKYSLTVPSEFFGDSSGVRGTDVEPDPIDKIELPTEGYLHFLFHRDMAEGKKKSCYVLTEEQFDLRFSDSDRWDGSMDQVPKFHK